MKLTDVLKKLEAVAPVALSDAFCKEYGMYDNSGIITDCGRDVNGALFSLDLSANAISKAKEHGFNLIVTHHPAIYGGINRLNFNDAIFDCIQSGISVISMHLNFDVAPKGIDYYLMRGLGGSNAQILAPVKGGGYGRVYDVEPTSFSEYLKKVAKTFSTQRALGYGEDKTVKKVASFCGAGCDNKAIDFAEANGADVFVSSDMKHHEITALLHKKINVIHLTHYSSETYGFNKIYDDVSGELGIPSAFFCDGQLI